MSTIALYEHPLYVGGVAPIRHKPRFGHLTLAPETPLYQLSRAQLRGLGSGPAVVATLGPIAAKATTGILTSTGAIAATSALIPIIGIGIGLVTALIAGFWSAHEARAKGAKTENAQVSSAVQAFDQTMKAIFAAANSSDPAQNISAAQAIQAVENAYSQFWNGVCSFTKGPGRADTSNCGANCGGPTSTSAPCAGMPYGHKCDKDCTVSCCVGCQDIKPSVDMAVAVFSAGGGTVQICNVAGDSYGLSSRGSYSLTYTAPTLVGSASGAVSSVSSALSSLFGGGSSTSGTGINPLFIGAALLAAWLVLR